MSRFVHAHHCYIAEEILFRLDFGQPILAVLFWQSKEIGQQVWNCSRIKNYRTLPPEWSTSTMNNFHHPHLHDMYLDQTSARAPGAQRHQQLGLNNQSSRQFDVYGQMPNTVYQTDEHGTRYEGNRFDRPMGSLQGGGYGYDPSTAQTWNPSAFAGNSFHPFGATGRMKSASRGGRTALPTVSSFFP